MKSRWQLNIIIDHDDVDSSELVDRLRLALEGSSLYPSHAIAGAVIDEVESAGRLGDA